MCFLKKHWRFTILVAVVLCVLLLGVVALYSTSETPEPKRVYVMPERSPDSSPIDNGVLHAVSTVPAAGSGPTATSNTETIAAESLESCCPDEASATTPQVVTDGTDSTPNVVPQSVIEEAKRYREWRAAAERYNKQADAHLEKASLIANSFMFSTADFLALVPPDQLAEIREQVDAPPSFWQSIPSPPNKTQEDIQSDFEALRSIFEAFAKDGLSLSHDAERVNSSGDAIK